MRHNTLVGDIASRPAFDPISVSTDQDQSRIATYLFA